MPLEEFKLSIRARVETARMEINAQLDTLRDGVLADGHAAIPHEHEPPPVIQPDCECTKSGRASDDGMWDVPPAEGNNLLIPAGVHCLWDKTFPPLGMVTVEGHLEFERKDLELIAEDIVVQPATHAHATARHGGEDHAGLVSAGTEDEPFLNRLTITLTGENPTALAAMGGRGLMAHGGGGIKLYGVKPDVVWTYLAAPVMPGDESIMLTEVPTGWVKGNRVILTTTDRDYLHTEERTIESLSGVWVRFSKSFDFYHHASFEMAEDEQGNTISDRWIDMRAKVGLLTRNIRVTSKRDALWEKGFGGHVMVMDTGSTGIFRGVEFDGLGQTGRLGRYGGPHGHNLNEGGVNFTVDGCSIHGSWNRGITVHRSHHTSLDDNVMFDIFGMGVFVEDGSEIKPRISGNLVAKIKNMSGAPGVASGENINLDIQPHFATEGQSSGHAAGIWITNPSAECIGNVVAGVEFGVGIWYAVPASLRPGSISHTADPSYSPRNEPFGICRRNSTEGIGGEPRGGYVSENGWGIDFGFTGGNRLCEDHTAFACAAGPLWCAGDGGFTEIRGFKCEAGHYGLTARSDLRIRDSLFMANTANKLDMSVYSDGRAAFTLYEGFLEMVGTVVSGFNVKNNAVVFSDQAQVTTKRDVFADCRFINCDIGFLNADPTGPVVSVVQDLDGSFGGKPGTYFHDDLKTLDDKQTIMEGKGLDENPAMLLLRPASFTPNRIALFQFYTNGAFRLTRSDERSLGEHIDSFVGYVNESFDIVIDRPDGEALDHGSFQLTNGGAEDTVTIRVRWNAANVTADVPQVGSLKEFRVWRSATFIDRGWLYAKITIGTGYAMRFRQ